MSAAGLPVRNGSMTTRRPSASSVKQAWPWKVMVTIRATSFSNVLLVPLAGQQLLDVRRVLHLQLDHPPRAVGIAVHERRIAFERRVHFGDRAGHRRVQIRHGFHRLDRAEHVPPPERRAYLGEVDVDDVAELSLRVIGDADVHDRTVARAFDILMIFTVTQIGRDVRHAGSLARGAWEVGAKVTGARNPCQPNGLPDGNRSGRGARPAAPGSMGRSRSYPQGRRSSRTATGSGSSDRYASTPGRPARVQACSAAAAAAGAATMA